MPPESCDHNNSPPSGNRAANPDVLVSRGQVLLSLNRVDEGKWSPDVFGIGNRDHPPRELPEPPYSIDVVADLHAGVYPDELADVLRPRILADPDSMAIWNALEATTDQLGDASAGSEPLPDFAQEKVDAALHSLFGAQMLEPVERPTPIWRQRSGVIAGLAAAAAVAGIAVATTFAFTGNSSQSAVAEDASTPTVISTPPEATLLAALGHSDTDVFVDRAARDRCLEANGVPASTPVLGTASIDSGSSPAVVVLLTTGTVGTFDALVVGPGCDTGNPATISRTTIGNK